CEYVEFYVETYDVPPDCDNARLRIDYGDGTVEEGVSWCTENYAYYYTYHGYNPSGGPYTATTSYTNDDGATWTEICSFEIECVEAGDCVINGWRYVRNDTSIDNSVSQWPTLALEEAKDRWDIDVNPQVVTQFQGWLEYSQCDNGGFGYDSPCSWVNFAKTGAGLAMLKWAGYGPGDTNVQDALSFLDSTWDSTCYDGNLGEFYAMYAFYKGMKYLGLSNLNGRAWEDLYTQYLIANQSTDGSWYDCGSWIPNPDMTTAIALAILAPAVAGLPPVADADGPYGPVNPGQNVLLDGSGSFHQDPTKVLVLYEWDFDASDGLWWDSAPAPDPGEGAVGITPTTSYPDTGADETYTVTLRVTDNSDPVMTDEDTSEVSVTTGNVPPVAQTNGPWAGLPGDTITFDATSSYDPNAGPPLNDYIASYEWDLDGDGVYNEAGGDDGTPVTPGDYSIVQKTYPSPVSQTVTLRVTDSFGLSDETSPQVSIVSIALVYGQDYDICFRDMINRFQQRLGIVVLFRNDGNATAENVVMTLTQTPTNLTILQDTAVLGTMGPGDEVSTACDPGAMTADIEVMLDRRIPPAGDWRWKAEFDVDGQHFILNNLPPIGP
ncbi:MAG: PKD domain-containing protein, partial [Thermodesulfobacteriota bacterium]|nr:PKD domain-containing protein [Thermodesulfobacteriota bacterium]